MIERDIKPVILDLARQFSIVTIEVQVFNISRKLK